VDGANRLKLIEAWIAYWQAADESSTRNDHSWATDQFYDISHESPELCLQLCEEMLAHDLDDETLAVLAAGPLEDALVVHGPTIIDAVERLAARDPRFRHLLGGVWGGRMLSEIWVRICAVREAAW